MFEAQTNDGYYSLGLRAAESICAGVAVGREVGARWETILGAEGEGGSKRSIQDKENERIGAKTEAEVRKLDQGQLPPTETIPADGESKVITHALRGTADQSL